MGTPVAVTWRMETGTAPTPPPPLLCVVSETSHASSVLAEVEEARLLAPLGCCIRKPRISRLVLRAPCGDPSGWVPSGGKNMALSLAKRCLKKEKAPRFQKQAVATQSSSRRQARAMDSTDAFSARSRAPSSTPWLPLEPLSSLGVQEHSTVPQSEAHWVTAAFTALLKALRTACTVDICANFSGYTRAVSRTVPTPRTGSMHSWVPIKEGKGVPGCESTLALGEWVIHSGAVPVKPV